MAGVTPALRIEPLPVAARELLRRCEEGVRAAERVEDPAERYCSAHLAAIRAAAAVLAVRGRPRRGRAAFNVWQVLPRVAPELTEWAVFFESGSARRAAAQAGLTTAVTARDADDLVRQVTLFAEVVAGQLGLIAAARSA